VRETNYEIREFSHNVLPFVFHKYQRCYKGEFRSNWHEDLELLQCTKGSGFIRYDSEQLPFTPDRVIVVNSNVLHNVGSTGNVECRCLIIDNSFFAANGVPVSTLHFQESITDPRILAQMEAIADSYERLDPEDYRTALTIRTLIQNLVQLLCQEFTAPKPATAASGYVKEAILYMTKNMAQRLSLDDVASAVGISKYYLSRQFKQFTGKTVIQTLNGIRCAWARQLIRDGMSISAAAGACGFESLPYFSSVFKKNFDKLPSDFIPKRNRRDNRVASR